jgi:hypothetical protein
MLTTLRTKALPLVLVPALLFAAPSAWAALVTFDFATFGAGGVPAGATNWTNHPVVGEHAYSPSFFLTVNGLTVTAAGTYNGNPAYVYLDGLDGGNPAGMGVCHTPGGNCAGSTDDNVTAGEVLKLVFGQDVTIDSVVFRNQDHLTNRFDAHDFFDLRAGGMGSYVTYGLPVNAAGLWVPPGTVGGSIFEFARNSEDFYISTITVRVPDTNVPEPGTLLLLGSGMLGLASRVRRRRS